MAAGAGLYLLASIGYYSSTVFYDSLLIDVTEPRYYSFVSALGFSLGYLGGALLLALHLWMLKSPATFGLENTTEVFSLAFVSVGAWWLVFLMPLLFFVPEQHSAMRSRAAPCGQPTASCRRRCRNRQVSQRRDLPRGLLACTSVVCSRLFSWRWITASVWVSATRTWFWRCSITNFAGFPATLLYGLAAHRFGPKKGIYFALARLYRCLHVGDVVMNTFEEFFVMAIIIGWCRAAFRV